MERKETGNLKLETGKRGPSTVKSWQKVNSSPSRGLRCLPPESGPGFSVPDPCSLIPGPSLSLSKKLQGTPIKAFIAAKDPVRSSFQFPVSVLLNPAPPDWNAS